MNKIKGDESAFPEITIDKNHDVYGNLYRDNYSYGGMNIRQKFAESAMQGLVSIYYTGDGIIPPIFPNEDNINYMAALSVKAADALIRELNKEVTP